MNLTKNDTVMIKTAPEDELIDKHTIFIWIEHSLVLKRLFTCLPLDASRILLYANHRLYISLYAQILASHFLDLEKSFSAFFFILHIYLCMHISIHICHFLVLTHPQIVVNISSKDHWLQILSWNPF